MSDRIEVIESVWHSNAASDQQRRLATLLLAPAASSESPTDHDTGSQPDQESGRELVRGGSEAA